MISKHVSHAELSQRGTGTQQIVRNFMEKDVWSVTVYMKDENEKNIENLQW